MERLRTFLVAATQDTRPAGKRHDRSRSTQSP
jgi:hypothetical protein